MATPLVAGCAALVREYYVARRGHEPSAALMKATLINGTRWLSGWDAIADHALRPNYHQGFGAVDMATTLPNNTAPTLALEFVDPWQNAADHLRRSGQRRRLDESDHLHVVVRIGNLEVIVRGVGISDRFATGGWLLHEQVEDVLEPVPRRIGVRQTDTQWRPCPHIDDDTFQVYRRISRWSTARHRPAMRSCARCAPRIAPRRPGAAFNAA